MSNAPAQIEQTLNIPTLEKFDNPTNKILTEYSSLKSKAADSQETANNPKISTSLRNQKILDLALTLQQMDEYVHKFDSTGAYSVEKFHKFIGTYMSDRAYQLDEHGHIKPNESDSNVTLVAISLDNLPYVNKRGSRIHGDSILAESVALAESKLEEQGFNVSNFDIVHLKGSDFVVIIREFEAGSESKADDFVKSINGLSPQSSESLATDFPPKLVACKTNREEAIKAFNEIQDKKFEQTGAQLTFADDKRTSKVITSIMIHQLEFQREYEILHSLAGSVVESTKMLKSRKNTDTGSGPETAGTIKDYEQYFNKYVKRFFEGTGLAEFSSLTGGDTQQMSETILKIAGRKVFEGLKTDDELDEIAEDVAMSITRSGEYLSSEQKREIKEASEIQLSEAENIYITAHKKELAKLSGLYSQYEKILLNTNNSLLSDKDFKLNDEQVDILIEFIENISNEMQNQKVDVRLFVKTADKNNYLPEILGLILDSYKKGETDTNELIKCLQTVRDLYGSALEAHLLKRDPMTGMIKRDEFYTRIGNHIQKALLKGDDGYIIFDDVNFLRYTNDIGGRRSGDLAININAKSLENGKDVLESARAGYNIEICRYAGDEFISYFSSDRKKVKANDSTNEELKVSDYFVQNMLSTLRRHEIPPSKSSSELFIPHEVSVGVGVCSIEQGIKFVKKVIEAGDSINEQDSQRLNQVLQDLPGYQTGEILADDNFEFFALTVARSMVRVSDKLVELNKSYERFEFLYGVFKRLKKQSELDSESTEWKAFNVLLSYSQKSLNEKGTNEFNQLYERYGDETVPREVIASLFGKQNTDEDELVDEVFSKVIQDIQRESKFMKTLR